MESVGAGWDGKESGVPAAAPTIPLPGEASARRVLTLGSCGESGNQRTKIHQAVAKDLNSSSNLSVSCVHTLQTPLKEIYGRQDRRYERDKTLIIFDPWALVGSPVPSERGKKG